MGMQQNKGPLSSASTRGTRPVRRTTLHTRPGGQFIAWSMDLMHRIALIESTCCTELSVECTHRQQSFDFAGGYLTARAQPPFAQLSRVPGMSGWTPLQLT